MQVGVKGSMLVLLFDACGHRQTCMGSGLQQHGSSTHVSSTGAHLLEGPSVSSAGCTCFEFQRCKPVCICSIDTGPKFSTAESDMKHKRYQRTMCVVHQITPRP